LGNVFKKSAYLTILLNSMLTLASVFFPERLFESDPVFTALIAGGASLGALVGIPLLAQTDIGPRRLLLLVTTQAVCLVLINAGVHHANGLVADGRLMPASYPTALYFSIVTWTTLGYGDFSPHPDFRLVAAMQACVGLIVFGVFVGLAMALLGRIIRQ